MSEWSPQDWGTFLGVLVTTLTGLYLGVVRPLLVQFKELILALKANTESTDVSARAQASNATATVQNTEVTKAVAERLPASGPVTVNIEGDAT